MRHGDDGFPSRRKFGKNHGDVVNLMCEGNIATGNDENHAADRIDREWKYQVVFGSISESKSPASE